MKVRLSQCISLKEYNQGYFNMNKEFESNVIPHIDDKIGKYQKIYDKVANNYPGLDDEIKIYNVSDDFLHNVNKEVAK